jgi:ATP-dependent DNA ligase
MAFAAFDLLELDSHSVMAKPWSARRKRIENLLETPSPVTKRLAACSWSLISLSHHGGAADAQL